MIPSSEEKAGLYRLSGAQIAEVTAHETDPVAVMASAACILKTNLPHASWVGFYRADTEKDDELVIGPYQGTLGCLRIPFGRGVCGTCAQTRQTVIVPNVLKFEGHIACDVNSASEIVVPVFDRKDNLCAVLDLDSTELNAFGEEDQKGLESVAKTIKAKLG